jgi:hypothetical protein
VSGAMQGNQFLMLFVTLVIIVVIGGVAHLIAEFCDNAKYQKYIDKATKIGAVGTLISMGLMVMGKIFELLEKFVKFVFG